MNFISYLHQKLIVAGFFYLHSWFFNSFIFLILLTVLINKQKFIFCYFTSPLFKSQYSSFLFSFLLSFIHSFPFPYLSTFNLLTNFNFQHECYLINLQKYSTLCYFFPLPIDLALALFILSTLSLSFVFIPPLILTELTTILLLSLLFLSVSSFLFLFFLHSFFPPPPNIPPYLGLPPFHPYYLLLPSQYFFVTRYPQLDSFYFFFCSSLNNS